VARTIDAWHEYTVEEACKRNLMKRIVQRMQKRGLVFALGVWHSNVLSTLHERAEEERRKHIVSRVLRMMFNQAQAGALERWRTNVSDLARQRDTMDKILRRMLNAMVAAGQTTPLSACLLRVLLIFEYA
jgi:hypothetical protein